LGVEKDYVQVDIWYLIAAASPTSDTETIKRTTQYSDDLEKRMTPEQIAEARKRAQEWKPTPSGASAEALPSN